MHSSLNHAAHRPWPLPAVGWTWRQTWRDLAYLHFRIEAASIRKRLPRAIEVNEFDGSAWVAIVPFRMGDVMRGSWPSIPPLRSFPEINVRTYVRHAGRPGVWFFSLDADCWPLVVARRMLYGLPYYKARISHV